MSVVHSASKSLDMLATALHGLDAIAEIAKAKWGNRPSLELLSMISDIVDSIRDGFAGKVDAQSINENIQKLKLDLLGNDAAAESELDKKFPK